jgi:DNA-binding MarR family transcriptional regulator
MTSGISTTDPATRPTIDALTETMGRLRRSTRRLVRRDWPYQPLHESELELVRFVSHNPGCRVRDAAKALGVAQNTVSTLVGRLVDEGLLARGRDQRDSRAAALSLTPAARRRISAWRDRRGEIVGDALSSLDAEDRGAIAAALPALAHLAQVLEER